jgi:hypothetical protein
MKLREIKREERRRRQSVYLQKMEMKKTIHVLSEDGDEERDAGEREKNQRNVWRGGEIEKK